tara:strand:+ start:601 stop:2628 length:2028 start_codon:yes stop_codon:yes gene_type:complete
MSKKLTNEEFIKRAREVHGDYYDYSLSNYTKAINKVIIICPIHGRFKQSPNNHINAKNGCNECGIQITKDKLSMSKDEFIERAEIIHMKKYNYDNVLVTGFHDNISIECSEHGIFTQKVSVHLLGGGCQKCSGRVSSDKNNFEKSFPALAEEFHPSKNGGEKPSDFTPFSGKKVFWLCSEGHPYEASIASRTGVNNTGCPFCSGQKLGYGNDLQSKFPYHASHWHPTKNGKLKPNQFMPTVKTKVWWLCPNGHEFDASIGAKTKTKEGLSGCPQCSHQNSYPQLLIYSELKYLFKNVHNRFRGYGSEIDIYVSDLNLSIEYDGEYWHRNKFKDDLQKYNNNIVQNELIQINVREKGLKQISNNDVIVDANGEDLDKVMPLINKIIEVCNISLKQKNILQKYINSNTLKNVDYLQELLLNLPKPPFEDSLKARFPELSKEFHPNKNGEAKPTDYYPFSNKKIWWKCQYNHEWDSTIQNRTYGNGCPYCSRKAVGYGNDFETTHPTIAVEWHPSKNINKHPSDFVSGSHYKAWWICPNGHEYESLIGERTSGGGCSYCAGKKIGQGNDFETKFPELSKEFHPTKNDELQPSQFAPFSHQKVWWQCKKKHEWPTSFSKRAMGQGCPYCSGNKIDDDYIEYLKKEIPRLRKKGWTINKITENVDVSIRIVRKILKNEPS